MKPLQRIIKPLLVTLLALTFSACAASSTDSLGTQTSDTTSQGASTLNSTLTPATNPPITGTVTPQGTETTTTTQATATQTTAIQTTSQPTATLAVLPPEFNTAVTIINATSPNAGQTTLAQLIDGDKPVVLWSFAAWCPQCRAEAPAIDAFAAANPDIQVIGIGSLDTAEASIGFIQDTGVQNSTMVWADEAGGLWQQLGFSGRTERLVVSPDLTQRQGPNGGQFDEARIRSQIASFN